MMPHAKDQLEVIIELHAAHARHAVDRDFAKVCSLVVELATELLHERDKHQHEANTHNKEPGD